MRRPICVDLWWYLAELCLEWEAFQTQVVVTVKTYILFNNFFWKSLYLWDNLEKYCTATQAPEHSTIQNKKDVICMPDN